MRRHRRLIETGLTLAFALVVVAAFGLGDILSAMVSAHVSYVALAVAFACCATLVAYFRFRMLVRAFGFEIAGQPTFFAFVSGQVSNQFLANILGQSVTRAALLQRQGVPASVTILLTWIERVVALAVLLALAFLGLAILLGQITIDLDDGGAYVISVAAGIVVALAVGVGVVVFRHSAQIGAGATNAALICAAAAAGLTVLIQMMTLGCYLAALTAVGIGSVGIDIAAAIAIVMLVTSLPISFGGWGVREFSTAHALGLVSIPAAPAVAGAVLVGVCFLFTLCALMVLASLLRRPLEVAKGVSATAPGKHESWDSLILWCAAVLAASLVFFNVHVPLETAVVSVNPADFVAVAALMVAGLTITYRRSTEAVSSWIWPGMLALTGLIALGLVIGYARHGWMDWAMLNRGLGWIAILGYVVAGVAAFRLMGERGRDTVLIAFVAVCFAICTAHILGLVVGRFVMPLPRGLLAYPLRGFAGNANAFALQIIFSLVALFALTVWRGRAHMRAVVVVVAVLLIALLLTHSRTGYILGALVLAAGVGFGIAQQRLRWAGILGLSALAAVSLFAVIEQPPKTAKAQGQVQARVQVDRAIAAKEVSFIHASSDNERLLSVRIGLDQWLQNPVFGGGLGGSVEAAKAEVGTLLVVHSTPVWVLGDFGLFGVAVAGLVFWNWGLHAAGRRGARVDPLTSAVVLTLFGVLLVGGLVHDFAFQRAFWFLLGIFAAMPAKNVRPAATLAVLTPERDTRLPRFSRPALQAAE